MTQEVAVESGALDLYAPKFGLSRLGGPGEKVILKIAACSKDKKKRMILFTGYTVGARHAQVTSKGLLQLGKAVLVDRPERYLDAEFINDVDSSLVTQKIEGEPRLVSEGNNVSLHVSGRILPAEVKRMYATGAKAFAILECCGKAFRISFGTDGAELFDLQRRKLTGISLHGGELTFLRRFQHPGAGVA